MTTTPTTVDELNLYEEVLNDLIPVARELLDTSKEIEARWTTPPWPAAEPGSRDAELRAVDLIGQHVAKRLDAAPTLLALALLRLASTDTR